jgi:hypothetical protein
MTDSASEGHIVNPPTEDEANSDPNRRGDVGDQGNDLRFAEEQHLIDQQAERHGAAAATTSMDPEKDRDRLNRPDDEGGYTDRDRT